MAALSARIRAWLQLLRAPNLLTVPGDPLAGYLLSSYGAFESSVWLAMGASLCSYAGGLILNDLADLSEDRRERPFRPLASGAISVGAASGALAICFGAALWLSAEIHSTALMVCAALLVAIASYNLGVKRLPLLGALNMGACRGLSLLLGATAVPHGELTFKLLAAGRLNHLAAACLLIILYIAAVTNLARHETASRVPRFVAELPPVALALGTALFLSHLASPGRAALAALLSLSEEYPLSRKLEALGGAAAHVLLLLAILLGIQSAWRLLRRPPNAVPPEIGQMIRLLLLIQSAFCAVIGSVESALAAATLAMLWPASRILGRWFYAS